MSFIDLLRTFDAQDTIAHIGPSVLYERFGYFRGVVSNVCIAEPDPVRAAALQKNIPAADRVRLLENAVICEGRRPELTRYNFDALTAIGETGALKSLFPGLRETERVAIGALSPASFIERLPQDHRGRDLLIIDSLGQEFDLLKEFDACDALVRFSSVIVRFTKLPTAAVSGQSDQLHDWLGERHFDRSIVIDDADPDLAVWLFLRNPLGEDLVEQQNLVKTLQSETKTQRDALEKSAAIAEKADSDLRVALRLQTVAHDDLKDLQRKFSTLYADKERQDKLLLQVTRKLTYASNHLYRLAAEAPEFARLVEDVSLDAGDDRYGAADIEPDKSDGPEMGDEDNQGQ